MKATVVNQTNSSLIIAVIHGFIMVLDFFHIGFRVQFATFSIRPFTVHFEAVVFIMIFRSICCGR